MGIATPGPVGMRPAFDRVAYERGRDAASASSRQQMIRLARAQIAEGIMDFEDQDRLVCHLICLSAAYLVTPMYEDAREALIEAEDELAELDKWMIALSHGLPDPMCRHLILRAALYYNASVLFFETGDLELGVHYLTHARENLSRVTSRSDMSRPLYASVDAVVSALEAQMTR